MTNIPARRIKRPKPAPVPDLKRGPAPDATREKCESNITTLLTEREFKAFETLRLKQPVPPTRSQWARYLIRDALSPRIRRDLPGFAADYRDL